MQHGKCFIILMIGSFMLLPTPAVAQDTQRAVQQIRDLLRRERVDGILLPNDSFDPSSFDPAEIDPLMLEAAWEQVRDPILRIFEREVGMTKDKVSLKLYVGILSDAPDAVPALDTSRPRRCRILFVEYEEIVRDVLRRALSLPRECLPTGLSPVSETTVRRNPELTVAWTDIAATTADLIRSNPEIRRQGLAAREPIETNRKIQVFTSWRKYGRFGGYDVFWRLFFQVKKSEQPGKVVVTVRGQVGRNLPGAETSRIEYLGTEEFDEKYSVLLGGEGCECIRRYVSDGSHTGPLPIEPVRVSSSMILASDLLTAYVQRLTR